MSEVGQILYEYVKFLHYIIKGQKKQGAQSRVNLIKHTVQSIEINKSVVFRSRCNDRDNIQ